LLALVLNSAGTMDGIEFFDRLPSHRKDRAIYVFSVRDAV
jgi:hypothetical protein